MGGSSGETQRSETTEKPSREQNQLLEGAMQFFKPYIRGGVPDMYSGSVIPGLNADQRGAQDMMRGAAGAQNDMWKDMARTYGNMSSMDMLDINKNKYAAGAMDAAIRPLQESFSEVQLPGISQEAVTAGGFGGSRQGIAEGIASGKLSQAIGDTTSKMGSDLYGQNLANLTKMMALGPQVMQGATQGAQTLGAVGSQDWALQQAQLQEQKDLFNAQSMLPFQMGTQLAGLSAGIPGGSQITMMPGATTSPWQSILGGASMGASVGGPYGAAAGGGLGALMALMG